MKREEWSLWQWIVFIFTREEPVGAIFAQASLQRAQHIELLVDRAQTLLAGRITKETEEGIKTWLETKATPAWLVNFANFLMRPIDLKAQNRIFIILG